MNVLIVDDSRAMQNIMTKSMKSMGYVTDQYSYAFDGEEALQVIRGSSPDIVLCDMHMPKMTGLEMLRKLRSENNPTKVIIVSIDDDPKTLASITEAGGNAYLKKPFTAEQLFGTVTQLVSKKLSADSKTKFDFRQLVPAPAVLERVLGSLAATDVKLVESRYADIDFDCSPFYGGTFQNDASHLVLSMFIDALAANTLSAIVNRRPIAEAATAAQAKRIDVSAKQALLAFLGVFSGLCKPQQSGNLLEVHAEHFAEDAHTHLIKHLQQYTDSMLVYTLNCGVSRGGKILLLGP